MVSGRGRIVFLFQIGVSFLPRHFVLSSAQARHDDPGMGEWEGDSEWKREWQWEKERFQGFGVSGEWFQGLVIPSRVSPHLCHTQPLSNPFSFTLFQTLPFSQLSISLNFSPNPNLFFHSSIFSIRAMKNRTGFPDYWCTGIHGQRREREIVDWGSWYGLAQREESREREREEGEGENDCTEPKRETERDPRKRRMTKIEEPMSAESE